MTYDWPKLKPEIIDLYLNQNLTLDEVTTRIARDHGQWIRSVPLNIILLALQTYKTTC